MTTITVGGVRITLEQGAIRWVAGLAVDADGAPDAYAPPGGALPAG